MIIKLCLKWIQICVRISSAFIGQNCANIILGYCSVLYKHLVNKEKLDITSNTCKVDR